MTFLSIKIEMTELKPRVNDVSRKVETRDDLIAKVRQAGHNSAVSWTRSFAVLATLALLLASLLMSTEANAATVQAQHSAMNMSGDCPHPVKHEGKPTFSQCCVAGCIVSVDPATVSEPATFAEPLAPFASVYDPAIRTFSEVEPPPPRAV